MIVKTGTAIIIGMTISPGARGSYPAPRVKVFFFADSGSPEAIGFNFPVDDRPSPLSNFQNPPVYNGHTQFKDAPKFGVWETKSLLDMLF